MGGYVPSDFGLAFNLNASEIHPPVASGFVSNINCLTGPLRPDNLLVNSSKEALSGSKQASSNTIKSASKPLRISGSEKWMKRA